MNNSISEGLENFINFHTAIKDTVKTCISNDCILSETAKLSDIVDQLSVIPDRGILANSHEYDSIAAFKFDKNGRYNFLDNCTIFRTTQSHRASFTSNISVINVFQKTTNTLNENTGRNYCIYGICCKELSVFNSDDGTAFISAVNVNLETENSFGGIDRQRNIYEAYPMNGHYSKNYLIGKRIINNDIKSIRIEDPEKFKQWFLNHLSIEEYEMSSLSSSNIEELSVIK